jgi:hypothetical protein
MTTLTALTRMMESYSHAVAQTRECEAWRLFIEECRCDLHRLPWSKDADCYVPEGFAQYWSFVATGESRDFDAKSGDYLAGARAYGGRNGAVIAPPTARPSLTHLLPE